MNISNISNNAKGTPQSAKTQRAEADAQRLAIWVERIARYTPERGVMRGEVLQSSPVRTKARLDAALSVLLEQGRATLKQDGRATRILPTAAILSSEKEGGAS